MNVVRSIACGATLTVLSWAATAADHHLCYETQAQNGRLAGVVACYEDSGGWCEVTSFGRAARGTSATWHASIQLAPMAHGTTVRVMEFIARTYTDVTIRFFDAGGQQQSERVCRVNARGEPASRDAVVTGFTTDASGLLTTAVWRLDAPSPLPTQRLALALPSDFVAIGGGVQGQAGAAAGLVFESTNPSVRGNGTGSCATFRCWWGGTSESGVSAPHFTTTFAIGLRIQGIESYDLLRLLRVATDTPRPWVPWPAGKQPNVPQGAVLGLASATFVDADKRQPVSDRSVVLGGGVTASPIGFEGRPRRFVTTSAPMVEPSSPDCVEYRDCKPGTPVIGWTVESLDSVAAPLNAAVTVDLIAMPESITVQWPPFTPARTLRATTTHMSAASPVAVGPGVDVSALPAGFALTSVGARVDWCCHTPYYYPAAPGNFLWRLEPRAEIRGASASAIDPPWKSFASVTTYAVGVRLD